MADEPRGFNPGWNAPQEPGHDPIAIGDQAPTPIHGVPEDSLPPPIKGGDGIKVEYDGQAYVISGDGTMEGLPVDGSVGWEELTDEVEDAIKNPSWEDLTDVPDTFPPSYHEHTWTEIKDKPATYPPSAHWHTVADISDFPQTWDWSDLTNVPATFPPAAHGHAISDVTGLQAELDTKIEDAPDDGQQYVRQNLAWEPVDIPEPAPGTIIADLPPVAPPQTLWWSSSTGMLSIKYNDGDSEQWVGIVGAGIPDAAVDGKAYVRWNGAWAEAAYLPLAGGTLTGNLTITRSWPGITLNKTASGQGSQVIGSLNGKSRWSMIFGSGVAEAGANVGSDFVLSRHADDGAWISDPIIVSRKTGNTELSGDLKIRSNNAHLYIDKAVAAADCGVVYQTAGKNRWYAGPDASAESGANAGSNYVLSRCNDAGAYLGAQVFVAYRSTGNVLFGNAVTAATFYSSQDYVSTTSNIVLSSNGAGGAVYLRPNGAGVSTGEFAVFTGGTLQGNGPVMAGAHGLVSGIVGGYACKAGISGVVGGNSFNWHWTNTVLNGYVDNVLLGSPSWLSDYRIKKDVEDLGSTWDIVKALRPIRYTQAEYEPAVHAEYVAQAHAKAEQRSEGEPEMPLPSSPLFAADDVERWGFIAHELQETMIESAATATKDAPDAIQSPNPWTIIAALTRTIQEMQERIEALEATP